MNKETGISVEALRNREIQELTFKAVAIKSNFDINPKLYSSPLNLVPASLVDAYGRIINREAAMDSSEEVLSNVHDIFKDSIKGEQTIDRKTYTLTIFGFESPITGKYFLKIHQDYPNEHKAVRIAQFDRVQEPNEHQSRQSRIKRIGHKIRKNLAEGANADMHNWK